MRLIETTEGLAMSADDAILRRLEELDRKVRTLETKRRYPGWCAVLMCGFLGGWLGRFITEPAHARAQAEGAKDIVAKSIKIVNDQGKPAVELSQDTFGGFGRVFNAEGKVIVNLEGDADGGYVRVSGQEGGERAFLGVGNKKGGGLLYFRNAEAKNFPVEIGVGPRGGYVNLNSLVSDKVAVWLGSDNTYNGVVHVHDNQGLHRCELGSNKEGGALSLTGSKRNQPHVYLGTGDLDLGGLLLLRNDDGKVRAEMGQGRNGGYLYLNGNKDDRPHIALDTSNDQRGGYLQVKSNSGKAIVEAGIDNTGAGYFDSFNRK
jgi:hypothetical protein